MEVLLNEMDSTRKIQIRMSLFTVHLAIANGMAMHNVLVGMKIDVFKFKNEVCNITPVCCLYYSSSGA
jgi:hypothetical protein